MDWAKGTAACQCCQQSRNRTPTGAQVLLVNKDDASETTFYIGGPGVSRSNPDYVAMEVINTVFGGRFTSWLNDELRVNTGLTYGANSDFSPLEKCRHVPDLNLYCNKKYGSGDGQSTGSVQPPALQQALMKKRLTSAKNYVKGGFPPRYETAGQLAAF